MPPVERAPGGTSLIDVLDRVLDKGIVIDAWVRVSLVGIDLITVEARVVVASIDTYLRYAEAMGITAPVARPPLAPATPARANHCCRSNRGRSRGAGARNLAAPVGHDRCPPRVAQRGAAEHDLRSGRRHPPRRSPSRARSSNWSIRARRSRRCSRACRARSATPRRRRAVRPGARRAARGRRPERARAHGRIDRGPARRRSTTHWSSPCAKACRSASTTYAHAQSTCARHARACSWTWRSRSFAVVPLRSTSEQVGLASWQGRDVPAVGVVLLSKEEPISDADIERLMPFATSAGAALVAASDVERLKDSSEQHAVEKEWLFWMVNGVRRSGRPDRRQQRHHPAEHAGRELFKASPGDSEGKARAIRMNNFMFTATLSTRKLEQGRPRDEPRADPGRSDRRHRAAVRDASTLPATNYFNGSRGTVTVLKNVTDLRHATEQVTQNVHRLQTAEEEIRLERDRLNLIMRSVPEPDHPARHRQPADPDEPRGAAAVPGLAARQRARPARAGVHEQRGASSPRSSRSCGSIRRRA